MIKSMAVVNLSKRDIRKELVEYLIGNVKRLGLVDSVVFTQKYTGDLGALYDALSSRLIDVKFIMADKHGRYGSIHCAGAVCDFGLVFTDEWTRLCDYTEIIKILKFSNTEYDEVSL